MRVLVVASTIPFPPAGGARTRLYHLLRALAGHERVTLVGFVFEGEAHDRPPFPVRVVPVPWHPPERWAALEGDDPLAAGRAYEALSRGFDEPWIVSYYESRRMRNAVRLLSADADVVVFEGSYMGLFRDAVRGPTATVVDFLDVHTHMAERFPSRYGDSRQFEFERLRHFESRLARRCSASLVVSEEEATAARRLLGVDATVVPNGVDLSSFTPGDVRVEEPATLLFSGSMDYEPNAEAARWFVEAVLPRVLAQVPDASLEVVGRSADQRVWELAGKHVTVQSDVPDMRPFLHRASVVVVPVLSGGGTRVKVLEAAACGKGIVSTPLGVEGLGLSHGREVLVGDSAEEFAAAVVELLRRPRRRRDLGQRARHAARRFDWDRIGAEFVSVLEGVTERAGR